MRRVATHTNYAWINPLQPMNVFISMSAFALGAAQLIFVINFFGSMWFGKKADKNPWESNTLEWTTSTPIPYYNYEKIPTVYGGPYEYSPKVPNGHGDWSPQDEPPQGGKSH